MAIRQEITSFASCYSRERSMKTSNIFTKPSRRDRMSTSVLLERFTPMIFGVVTFAALAKYGKPLFIMAESNKWHLDNLYNSVFAFTSFAAAFLFALYTYVQTVDSRAIKAIKESIYFSRACRHMWWAISILSLVALSSIPMLVVVPEPTTKGPVFWLSISWMSLIVYSICAASRSLYHFVAILDAADGGRLK